MKTVTVESVAGRLMDLRGDEVLLVDVLLDRIMRGRVVYGAWVAEHEGRDLDHERFEELLDGLVYGAMIDARRPTDV